MKHTASLFVSALACIALAGCCSAPQTAPPPEEPAAAEAAPVVAGPTETAPEATCGGIAGVQCGEGMFCKLDGHCGAGDQSGVCQTVPEMCTRDYRPVCGCDGETYGNACTAYAAGVSVQRKGKCDE